MLDLTQAKSINRETGEENTENPPLADNLATSNTGTDSSAQSPAIAAGNPSSSITGTTKETDEEPVGRLLAGTSPETPTGALASAQRAALGAQVATDEDKSKRPISNTEYVFWHLHQCLKAVEKLVPGDSPHGVAVTMHRQQLIDLRNLLVEYDHAIEGLF